MFANNKLKYQAATFLYTIKVKIIFITIFQNFIEAGLKKNAYQKSKY
jgi:hypothetical protein